MVFVYVIGFVIFMAVMTYLNSILDQRKSSKKTKKSPVNYHYERKDTVMSQAESAFFKRLEKVVEDRYYIFPQIHLSALMNNKTSGRYYKVAFQRINRRSVDYVLCDKATMKPVYAVELDDTTHDTDKRKYRGSLVGSLLLDIDLPLVRFRNVGKMTDDQIAQKFEEAVLSKNS